MLVPRRPSGFVLLAILSQRTRRVQSPADLLDRLAIQTSVCNRGKTVARRGRSYSVNGDRRIWLPGCTDCAFVGNKINSTSLGSPSPPSLSAFLSSPCKSDLAILNHIEREIRKAGARDVSAHGLGGADSTRSAQAPQSARIRLARSAHLERGALLRSLSIRRLSVARV
jgi:hypothetical protein